MDVIIILVIVNLVAIGAYWIYSTLIEANKNESRLNELIEKESKEHGEFVLKETLFNQFKDYVLNLFLEKNQYTKQELINRLKVDHPFYKDGDNYELAHDLYFAGLIRTNFTKDTYEKGNSFQDLKLVYPELIKFLEDRCNINEMFIHNMHSKHSIKEAEISKSLKSTGNSLTYYVFGVCNGKSLGDKIDISSHKVEPTSHYLYGKTIEKQPSSKKEKILIQNYKLLTDKIDYQKTLNIWSLIAF